MRILIIIFVITFFNECGRNDSNKTSAIINIDSLKTNNTHFSVECIQRDTITELGTKIHYINRNGKFQISWGDNTYNRIYDSLFYCDYDKNSGLWNFVPKLNNETRKNLIFTNILWTSSGANPAPIEFYAIVCPKNKMDSIFEKEFFINSQGDYLVYGDPNNENINIINIETKKYQAILLRPEPYLSKSPTSSILKTEIKGETLYIKYEALDKNEETIIIEKKFTIEI